MGLFDIFKKKNETWIHTTIYGCPDCGKEFTSEYHVHEHMDVCQISCCRYCSKKFKTEDKRDMHEDRCFQNPNRTKLFGIV